MFKIEAILSALWVVSLAALVYYGSIVLVVAL